ncbi:hypothetical protein VPH35_059903 [Triticum aestivum]
MIRRSRWAAAGKRRSGAAQLSGRLGRAAAVCADGCSTSRLGEVQVGPDPCWSGVRATIGAWLEALVERRVWRGPAAMQWRDLMESAWSRGGGASSRYRWVTALRWLGQNGVLASSERPVIPVWCGEWRCAPGGADLGVLGGEAVLAVTRPSLGADDDRRGRCWTLPEEWGGYGSSSRLGVGVAVIPLAVRAAGRRPSALQLRLQGVAMVAV